MRLGEERQENDVLKVKEIYRKGGEAEKLQVTVLMT